MSVQPALLETTPHHARFLLANQNKYFFAAYWHLIDSVETGNLNLIFMGIKEVNHSIEAVGVLNLEPASVQWMEHILSFVGSYIQRVTSIYLKDQCGLIQVELLKLEVLYKLAVKPFPES